MKRVALVALILALVLAPLPRATIAQAPPQGGGNPEDFLRQTKEFLTRYVLPDIEKEIEIYVSAGIPPPIELSEILTIGKGVETTEDIAAFDRAVRRYVENGPTLPPLTGEQVRTIAEGFEDILGRIASSGTDTADLQDLLDEAETGEDFKRFFAAMASRVQSPALSPGGEPMTPSLVVAGTDEETEETPAPSASLPAGQTGAGAGQAEEAEEATESEPQPGARRAEPRTELGSGAGRTEPDSVEVISIDLSSLGSFEDVKATMRSYTSALSQAGASVREIDRALREANAGEDLTALLPSLATLSVAFPLPELSSSRALLEVATAELGALQNNVAHLTALSPLSLSDITSKLRSLEAELLLLDGTESQDENGKEAELFLSHLRATLQEVFGFGPTPIEEPAVEDVQEELLGILLDLQDLLSTTIADDEDRTLLAEAFRALEMPSGGFQTLTEMETWFSANAQHLETLRRVLPSPSLSEVQSDLRIVLQSLEQHLSGLEGLQISRDLLQPQLLELRSSLESLTTEDQLDVWFERFDAFYSSLTANES